MFYTESSVSQEVANRFSEIILTRIRSKVVRLENSLASDNKFEIHFKLLRTKREFSKIRK